MNENFVERLKNVANLVPLLTVLTFVYGYIGFYTFITIYQIPVISTDISIIASIGLFNLAYMGMLYFTASSKRQPYYAETLFVYTTFLIFLSSPTIAASMLTLNFMLLGVFTYKTPTKISFKDLKTKVLKYKKRIRRYDIIISVLGMITLIFFDSGYFIMVIFIYTLLFLLHRYKKYKIKFDIFTLATIILFPAITMYYFINNSESNILGLNKQQAKIITTSSDTIITTIIFSDDKYYYLHDDSLKSVTSLNKSEVCKIITKSNERPINGVTEIKKLFH